MRVAMFSTKPYDRRSFEEAGTAGLDFRWLEARLTRETVSLAEGSPAVCLFVNDEADASVIASLASGGTRLIALRCAGFNNVDLAAAEAHGVSVVRVPAYSPHAVAEFTVGLLLALVRRIHKAYTRTRENNFSLDGLLGFDLHGRTVGVIGTGRIGALVARIMRTGFGCHVLAHDVRRAAALEEIGVVYASRAELLANADIITLHCPLTPETHYLLDRQSLALLRPGAIVVNTSRGALIDTEAAIDALKTGQLGGLAIDVYEQEADLFFEDLSAEIIQDDALQRLLMFPNVLVTGHQAFFTREALSAIASTTLANIRDFAAGRPLVNTVTAASVKG
ncbi:2-hydroxyacid dehydrogenase [Elioraea tepida]|uniref:2-hydroxyacid dehydrogenase n=1 Tax=Elioraea tepida TaxID=2843330 RepID=A0A975U2G8_9PROT|nr:2-hydroxyacid dehydrogenase [Elioraea tepida]QXM24153.1 2-hydroxyacid dehydrogenase [Elioraea tepida]